jgi:hypothetical protein
MIKRVHLVGLPLAVLVISCAGDTKAKPANNRDTMTQRQRDSVFGQSAVPGAGAVTKAMKMADSLDAIRKRQDSAMAKPDTGLRSP